MNVLMEDIQKAKDCYKKKHENQGITLALKEVVRLQ